VFLCVCCKSSEPYESNNYCLILFILTREPRHIHPSHPPASTTSKIHQQGQSNNRSASARAISKKCPRHQSLSVLPLSISIYYPVFIPKAGGTYKLSKQVLPHINKTFLMHISTFIINSMEQSSCKSYSLVTSQEIPCRRHFAVFARIHKACLNRAS
jgi:hypothetical protein